MIVVGCRFAGCLETIPSGTGGYCPEHKKQNSAYRGSAASRGYDYQWQRFRSWFVKRHPLCHDCLYKPTEAVHHIAKLADHPALRLVESNCLGLCNSCHQIRTNRGE